MTQSTQKTTITPQVISLRDLFETLLLNLRVLGIFILGFFIIGTLYAYFRTPVFQTRALLQISKSSASGLLSQLSSMHALSSLGSTDKVVAAQLYIRTPVFQTRALLQISKSSASGLLSQLSSMHALSSLGSTDKVVAAQLYILHSRGVLENAITINHLDIHVKPWYFPIIGTALSHYYDQHPKYLTLAPVKPRLNLSRYSWGGDSVTVDQFTVPVLLTDKNFTLIYGGNNQFQLLSGDKIILTGQVGQLAAAGDFSLLISKISANPNTHFDIKRLSMTKAIKYLRSKIAVTLAGSNTNLLRLRMIGQPHEHLQTVLNAVINNVVDLNIRARALKAQKTLAFVNNQLPLVQAHLARLNAKLSGMLPMGPRFNNLLQQRNLQNMIYNNLLLDAEQYDLKQASSLGNVTVLTPPTPISSAQLFPDWALALLITFLGFLLGITFIFARHYLLGMVYDPTEIEQSTGLSLLTALQVIKAQTQQIQLFQKKRVSHLKLLSELNNCDVSLEGFRSLRTALLINYFMDDNTGSAKNNIITVGGPTPNIGKSFVAVNFAQQLAEAGKCTLLIDADMRKGSVGEYFDNLPENKGFVDWIKGSCTAESCIAKPRFANLDVMPSGLLQSRNAELLLQDNVECLLATLSKQYDFIVIDTAPILLVNDALSICRVAKVNLLTFAYGKHNAREIDMTISRFEKAHIPLHGFVMNFMPVAKLGYGYGYGHQYGHVDAR